MAFFTSLVFYRPCAPPIVTANDLAGFLSELRETGALTDAGLLGLRVKFGASIDQDQNATSWEEEVRPMIYVSRGIEWDLNLSDPACLQDIIDRLTGDQRRIYRAFVFMGGLIDAVRDPITRKNSPENKQDYCPDSLALEIGPIELYDLDGKARPLVGWIGVSISGYGYLYPWTFHDVLLRLEATPEAQRILNVCRSFWPVRPEQPTTRIVEMRRQIGDLWPYNTFDNHWDWYWGLQESG